MVIFYAECEDGFYDSDCSSTCGRCLNGEYCDKITGHCLRGCQSHFHPPFCQGTTYNKKSPPFKNEQLLAHTLQSQLCVLCLFIQVCKDGFYGSSCQNNCGHCLNGEHCDKRNGTCIKGCQPHFLYPLCKGNITNFREK